MPKTIKKGSKVYVTEGPHKGSQGTVTKLERAFDVDTLTKRWTVWADNVDGRGRIKTRLSFVREI